MLWGTAFDKQRGSGFLYADEAGRDFEKTAAGRGACYEYGAESLNRGVFDSDSFCSFGTLRGRYKIVFTERFLKEGNYLLVSGRTDGEAVLSEYRSFWNLEGISEENFEGIIRYEDGFL